MVIMFFGGSDKKKKMGVCVEGGWVGVGVGFALLIQIASCVKAL